MSFEPAHFHFGKMLSASEVKQQKWLFLDEETVTELAQAPPQE